MGEVWSAEKYKVARDPVNVGGVDALSTFSKPGAQEVRNMLIKLPGKGKFEVPAELAQFKDTLQKIVDHERSVNPNMDEYYAYVTVDQRAFKAGQAPGGDTALHYDGLQGADVKEKVLPSHSYEVSDNGPTGTTFHPIGIDFSHFPDDKFDWNSVLQRQASRDVTPTMRARPGEIYLSDAYTARAATTASEDGTRTALRVEFSQSRHATDGDTINPLLKDKPGYQWDFTPKPAEPSLIKVQPEASFAPSAATSDALAMSRSASSLDAVLTPQQLSDGLNALHAIPQSTVDLVMANLERIRALKKSGTLTAANLSWHLPDSLGTKGNPLLALMANEKEAFEPAFRSFHDNVFLEGKRHPVSSTSQRQS